MTSTIVVYSRYVWKIKKYEVQIFGFQQQMLWDM